MSKKELLKTIRERLDSGKTKDEVFAELKNIYAEEKVARYLVRNTTKVLKEKYKIIHMVLLIFIVLDFILRMILSAPNYYHIISQGVTIGYIVEVSIAFLLIFLLYGALLSGVRKYRFWYFMVLVIFYFLRILMSSRFDELILVLNSLVVVTIAVIALALIVKLFPGAFGSLKKDSNGRYYF